MVQAVFNVILWTVVIASGRSPHSTGDWMTWFLIGAQIPVVCIIVDALVVYFYLRRLSGTFSIRAGHETFVRGATWSLLRELAARAKDLTKARTEMESMYPELKDDPRFVDAFSRGDVVTLSLMEEKAYRRLEREHHEMERRAHKVAAQSAELLALLREAAQLGADQQHLNAARKSGIPAARELISMLKRRNTLLENANHIGCGELVQSKLWTDGLDIAYALYLRLEALTERAARCGAVAVFASQNYIRLGELERAEKIIMDAENEQMWERQKILLLTQAHKLKLSSRGDLSVRIEALGRLQYGSREFRIALHGIERDLKS